MESSPGIRAGVEMSAALGEWIAPEAVTELTRGQGAFARGVLHDEIGHFGRSAQSLFIGPRG